MCVCVSENRNLWFIFFPPMYMVIIHVSYQILLMAALSSRHEWLQIFLQDWLQLLECINQKDICYMRKLIQRKSFYCSINCCQKLKGNKWKTATQEDRFLENDASKFTFRSTLKLHLKDYYKIKAFSTKNWKHFCKGNINLSFLNINIHPSSVFTW